ncbi:MAG TPA: sulfatase-like hydrolase/transferase [Candidatus Acidoferrum sp.]|nr:sulfatase-like hydrolase/transferase [Candidatus Acidoferrum sp.]
MISPRVAQPGNAWRSAASSVLPWVIPATLSIYIKADLLKNKRAMHGGYVIAARSLGRVSLSYWEKISFFRADFLVAFLLVPLGLLLVSRYVLPHRWRTSFIVLFSLASTVVLYLELSSFDAAGQFLSSHVMSAAITWGLLHDRSTIAKYLPWKPLAALVGLAAAMIAWRWQANRKMRIDGNSSGSRRWNIGAAVVLSGLTVVTITAWASPFPATPYHRNVLGWILRSLADRTDTQTLEFVNLPDVELQNQYRAIATFSTPARDARYWGKAKGSNVLFFVLETAPARVLPADGDLADFPNLQRLRERSLVGASHYTTYAATHQAMFSILSSWYPSTAIARVQNRQPDVVLPGLISSLSDLGYDTAFYSPIDFKGEPDAEMYRSLGFQRQVYPPLESANFDVESSSSFNSNGSARIRMALDLTAAGLLKGDLERDLAEGRKFAYVFEPEVSHGPWADLKEDGKEQNVEKRGRNILQIPDQMLGEIMEVLQRHNQLENTVIVVVGDHGVRNPIEDPSLASGTIDDYSFHVPLFIYAPKALEHRVEIPYVTSHIDIVPSVRSLLGIEQGENFEQGTPVWDPGLANRTVFFFGHDYLAADGFYSRGKFFMWSQMSDAVYENTQMSFDKINPVPRNSPVYHEVTKEITRMGSLNEVWAMHFGASKRPHNYVALNSKP